MKKFTFLFLQKPFFSWVMVFVFLFLNSAIVFSQALWPNANPDLRKTIPMDKKIEPFLPLQNVHPDEHFDNNTINYRDTEIETTIGTTKYDLQTNASPCNRISEDANGNMYGVWTQGFSNSNGYPDRGTGYNSFTEGAWGDVPTTRLEASVRSGWPNHVITDSGVEYIGAHVSAGADGYRIHTLRRTSEETDWTEGEIPTNTPKGVLWPRLASGGNDGETIHAIAITTPAAFGGVNYGGIDRHILYYRSTDAGLTWDIVDAIIPGLDSTNFAWMNSDAYVIDARGDDVAIGIFGGWNDILVFKSQNNGDTWTKYIVHDFPLEKYEINDGYTFEDIGHLYNPDIYPDSMAIFTSDDAGTLILDKNGMAHVFFGNMFLNDETTTDDGWTYYPFTSGISYWNETYGDDSLTNVIGYLDLNDNDTIEIASIDKIAKYYTSLTGFPTASVDDYNNL